MDAETQARIERLVALYAAQAAAQDARAKTAAVSLWSGFAEWYTAAAVQEIAQEAAAQSAVGQQVAAGLAQQYARTMVDLMRPAGSAAAGAKTLLLPPVRKGVDLVEVYTRPAAKYRRTYAFTEDLERASADALARAQDLVETDQLLTRREVTQQTYKALGITRLRRVIHPELSESGTCGLCAVASTRTYLVDELMSIHPPHCKCTSVPVLSDADPGAVLNEKDLPALYAAAGGTSAAKLKRIRVRQHGEYGPTLVDADHSFRAPRDVKGDDEATVAAKQLDVLRPVLANLERREAAGEDVTDPLRYQRGLIARLEAIAPPQ
jgi:hypothetical protein